MRKKHAYFVESLILHSTQLVLLYQTMKKLILSLAIVASASALSYGQSSKASAKNQAAAPAAKAATAPAAKGPQITWDKTVYEFGNIPQGVPATGTFKFTNTGTAPVILSDVKGSCGCTVPEWPKEPIMPGKTGIIKATYNAANPGAFNKSITVTANTENSTTVLFIKGDVAAKQ